MTTTRHSISIGTERIGSEVFISLKATGKLTHEDYGIITPMIESALSGAEDSSARLFIDGSEFEGWEPRAAWDDLKLGLKHNKEFKKIAICGNKKWQKTIAKTASWFVAGEVQFFEHPQDSFNWLL